MADLKVVPILPCNDIPAMLRKLADEVEGMQIDRITVVLPDGDVRVFGGAQEMIAFHLVYDCQAAIYRALSAGYQVPVVIRGEEC